ncbi:GntR family transcriptional regulator [Pseudonocardia ailaonensis]|uniref:GntR family transcriptional regulator n=1 Tax=Pseudonocardia ailaonensis TaxID=367279 RepID=A0ABN2N1W9_9PSEU
MTADLSLPRPAGRVRRASLSSQVVEHIKNLVFDGTLKAGTRVPQDAIAAELGVSRVPVREALITLEESGLVASEPHRGMFVLPIRAEDVEDHYRMYGMIQALAAVRAADRITEPVLEKLEELHVRMVAGQEDPHPLNAEFHQLVNRTGGSKRVRAVLRHLSRNFSDEVFTVPPAADEQACADHKAIIAALRCGDRPALDAVHQRHVRREGDAVVAELARRGVLAD